MLYILPPPQTAKPPSVWDLILNFHRKGCPDSDPASYMPLKKAKLPLKFSANERRVHESWCNKTTMSSCQTKALSHVRRGRKSHNKRYMYSNDLKKLIFAGSVSLSREIARQIEPQLHRACEHELWESRVEWRKSIKKFLFLCTRRRRQAMSDSIFTFFTLKRGK